jgi:hypothetical protein
MDVQKIELSRHLFLAERLTKRAMDAAKTPKALVIAKQVHDTRMLLPGSGDHHEQLSARSQLRQASLEVETERVQLDPDRSP